MSAIPRRSIRRTLGLIGYGAFGRFIAPYLADYFSVTVYDLVEENPTTVHDTRIQRATLIDAAKCDIVVLAPPVQALNSVLVAIAPYVRPGALVADVASVKSRPVALMREHLPTSVDIIGLHPLFGPQSGRHGIQKLPIVVCPVRPTNPTRVIDFLGGKLGLAVSVQTPEDHDRTMAHVQALTHFVAAALSRMQLPNTAIATPSYSHLRTFVEMVRFDSPALYQAIQEENPYAGAVRKEFVHTVLTLAKMNPEATPHP